MAVRTAHRLGVGNFSMLVSHVLVPPAMEAILGAPDNRVQGFLGPGHVCAVMGYRDYEALADRHRVPIVISGFEPVDLLEGIYLTIRQLEAGRATVENQYVRTVVRDGNAAARALIDEVFEVCDQQWRGVGAIPGSGYRLRAAFQDQDAVRRFEVGAIETAEPVECISGQVLRGLARPSDCPAFGKRCTPLRPLGATMVSAEGACAAYYQYGRHQEGRGDGG